MKEFAVDSKKVTIYISNETRKELPLIVLNTFEEAGKDVFEKCIELKVKDFVLVSISNLKWNQELTPWPAPKIDKREEDFTGGAKEYLYTLTKTILPMVEEYLSKENIQISEYIIAGYSLAGLFAMYSAYQTDIFSKIISASGSFWYPNFLEYVKENQMNKNVKEVYLSLGNQESKTKHPLLQTVEWNTKSIAKIIEERGIQVIYEENEGNHFQDANIRMSKGITWALGKPS